MHTCCLALLLDLYDGSIQDLHCHGRKVCRLPWSRNTLQDGDGPTDIRVHSHLSERPLRHAKGCQLISGFWFAWEQGVQKGWGIRC